MVPKIQDMAILSWRCHARSRASTGVSEEDVVVEGVAAECEENLVPPASVGDGGGVEDDGDQVLDVEDPGGLEVEVGDHGVNLAKLGFGTLLN
jgi:hypothetical protein